MAALEAVQTIAQGKKLKKFRQANTEVKVGENKEVLMYLHGSAVAYRKGERIAVCDAGHQTVTTKSRINAVLSYMNMKVVQKKFEWHLVRFMDCEPKIVSWNDGGWNVVRGGTPMELIAAAAEGTPA